ncbi:MAG: hypothetical protein QOI31_1891 [Solirubrobacterales bacterium]|jgi:beta-lactam-binding protein with PASTA domain|nr:hypothetical protein [Solirubrobacterales bacterium]
MRKMMLALVTAVAISGCGTDFGGAPDVRGMNLQDANRQLKQAGFNSSVVENDGFFGVVIESNFVVCGQESTQGSLVPLQVAKHGC